MLSTSRRKCSSDLCTVQCGRELASWKQTNRAELGAFSRYVQCAAVLVRTFGVREVAACRSGNLRGKFRLPIPSFAASSTSALPQARDGAVYVLYPMATATELVPELLEA